MADKWTAPRIRALKGKGPFACLTVYDFITARLADVAGIPLALVGDSLGMSVLGYETTLPVTLEQMLHHTAAAARGAHHALVVTDLPFLTYQVSIAQAIESAGRALQAGASAVKIEGGAYRAGTVSVLVENGIPVLGHIGLLPQNVRAMGGYKVQGKTQGEVDQLVADAIALEKAGSFALVVEGVPPATATRITEAVGIPTIGIGAGVGCDGQVLVISDLLGLTPGPSPKFVKRYAELGEQMGKAIAAYKHDVEKGLFPGPGHTY